MYLMQTINISLPERLAKKIDQVVGREGYASRYASRSEFIRALVRFYLLSENREEVKLLPFKKVPLKTLEEEMRATGRYNEKFVKSVIRGLSLSSVYAKNKASS